MATEATEGMIYYGKRFLSVQNVEIIDLISEGEIEGLATGNYLVEGKLGEVGWRSATFSGFTVPSGENGQEFLRSVYWNQTPVIDDNGRSNFQKASVSFSPGDSDGGQDLNIGERDIINENFNPITSIAGASNFTKLTVNTSSSSSYQGTQDKSDPSNYGRYSSFNRDVFPIRGISSLNEHTSRGDQNCEAYLSTTKIFRAGSTYHFDLGLTGGGADLTGLVAMGTKSDGSFQRYGDYRFTTTGGAQNLAFSITPTTDSPLLYIAFRGGCGFYSVSVRDFDGVQTQYACRFTAPSLNNCDISLSRAIVSRNGGTSIVAKNSLNNWVVTANCSPSFDPAIFTFTFNTVAETQTWTPYSGSGSELNTSNTHASILVVPTTLKQANNFYGGTYYATSATDGGWGFEQECSVHISAISVGNTEAKVRFSFSENTPSPDETVEAFGFDMTLTNDYVLHEYFCLGKRALLGAYRLNLLSINGVSFKVDFIQINKAAIRVEIDAPRKLELFKKYNFSVNIKGTYNDPLIMSEERLRIKMPVVLGISNRSSSAELISNQPFTTIVPYSSL